MPGTIPAALKYAPPKNRGTCKHPTLNHTCTYNCSKLWPMPPVEYIRIENRKRKKHKKARSRRRSAALSSGMNGQIAVVPLTRA
jgi:hypothetical protein